MLIPNKFKSTKVWWDQFPYQLKLITKIRFFASFGAGGVLYLTSLIFNNIGLSATEIGLGFTISAIIGTLTRFITGNYLNKKGNILLPLIISSSFSVIASVLLIYSTNTFYYVIGQSFIGAAAGIYWPSVEISIPYLCFPIETRKAYALVRSSEALGIFLGVFIGTIFNSLSYLKYVYCNDIVCMIIIVFIILKNKTLLKAPINNQNLQEIRLKIKGKNKWHRDTPLIISSLVLITTCLALIQVTLPLDLVRGGILRQSIGKDITSIIITIQLILLLIFQYPIGSWISNKGRLFGLKVSLLNFFITSLLLFISSYFKSIGIFLVIFSIIFSSLGACSFLPTSTDIVFRIAPESQKGFALALLSQCFAMGYFIGPYISGIILDSFGNASLIWLLIAFMCFFLNLLIYKKRFQLSKTLLSSN